MCQMRIMGTVGIGMDEDSLVGWETVVTVPEYFHARTPPKVRGRYITRLPRLF